MPILRVNQVTDYERIDHQQKSERAGPHATSGRRALQRLAQCRVSSRQAWWFGPDASVGPTRAMADSARQLGAKRGFDARLSGGGSYEGQCRCAFLLYRKKIFQNVLPICWGERFFADSAMNQAARKFGVRMHTNKLVA